MKPFRADLHCHSTCSDGSQTPVELMQDALEIGLQGFSITDHDSIDAYRIALPIAKRWEIPMISGVEFSAVHKDTSIHVLGYAFSLYDRGIIEFCRRHNKRREERNAMILQKLKEQGMPVEKEELRQVDLVDLPCGRWTVGRPHIAQAMIKRGYVSTIQEAFRRYIGEEGSCYARGPLFGVQETIDVIHAAGGKAVIAHPQLIKRKKVVKDLLNLNFDGLEAYYARLHKNLEEKWVRIAEEKGWFYTGGSDCHGSVKPHIVLGCSWTSEATFRMLLECFESNQ